MPNPRTLDVTDACTVLNHSFAISGVKWPRVLSHNNSLEWPCLFLWDSLIQRAQSARRSSPKPRLCFPLSRRPLRGSLCDKCILCCARSPWIPPAAMWAQLPQVPCCPSFHDLPTGTEELFIRYSSSASFNYRAKFTAFS